MAALRAGHHSQPLGGSLFACGDDGAGARGIHGHRLFDETMFAGLHGSREMQRPEQWRRSHQHVFAVAGDDFLITVETTEAAILAQAILIACRECRTAEGITHRHHFGFVTENLAGRGKILERSPASPAAADQAYFDFS